jgi:hypothetical protein
MASGRQENEVDALSNEILFTGYLQTCASKKPIGTYLKTKLDRYHFCVTYSKNCLSRKARNDVDLTLDDLCGLFTLAFGAYDCLETMEVTPLAYMEHKLPALARKYSRCPRIKVLMGVLQNFTVGTKRKLSCDCLSDNEVLLDCLVQQNNRKYLIELYLLLCPDWRAKYAKI